VSKASNFSPLPKKTQRKIPKAPYKVLEAPQIQDDFYLNLVDWSSLNLLAVGLSKSVYLWNASTSQVTSLCDVAPTEMVTSLSWMNRGTHLAVGSSDGSVTLWDVAKQRKIRTFLGHKARVGTMAWGNSPQWILTTGSRDRTILQRDVRTEKQFVSRLTAHKQEVCGLKWGYNPSNLLASGGNDNKLFVWDQRITKEDSQKNQTPSAPLYSFLSHKAAVKGLTWSPHQRGFLASGGGTADQCIRFWNTITGQELNNSIDTGSQVCNLAWSKNVNELVSTHGYSQNQITVWAYPSLTQIATLTGHTMRVLYLSVSPDGQTIVTGAGDETLRFWSIFPKAKVTGSRDLTSSLYSFSDIR
jgi:cell division cycle 20-like protein 1 (cofactor of APC complex)